MKIHILAATAISLTTMFEPALAQVPPQLADEIRKIATKRPADSLREQRRKYDELYELLFQNQKEPYPKVTVARDIASVGTAMSTDRIGSSSTGRAFGSASPMAILAAARNAISDESTE